MSLDEIGATFSRLGEEWEAETSKPDPNPLELDHIMSEYALQAGFLYGLAYRQDKAIRQASLRLRDEVRQTMWVIDDYLKAKKETEK
jgi:hypothetical protein